MGLSYHRGYVGVFTRATYPGALASGIRVVKANSESGDYTVDGTAGTIMGSIGNPEIGILYFIEWDNRPGYVIGCVEKKVVNLT